MLATLFDFPFEDLGSLLVGQTWQLRMSSLESLRVKSKESRAIECLEYFTGLWNERVNAPPRNDLISMLAHGESTKNMDPAEYLGNLILLIVGGNDTTRNSISGGIKFLNENPLEYQN